MQFLANENFPAPSIKLLREKYYVYSIAEESPGLTDLEVIGIALDKNLIILTFDRDYGEILFKYNHFPIPSVIYFRYKGKTPESTGLFLLKLIQSGSFQFENHFTVVEEDRLRQRKY